MVKRPFKLANVYVESSVATKLVYGTVTTGITPTQVATPGTVLSKSGFNFRAGFSNSGIVYLGKSDVTAANGYPLAAGDFVFLALEDLSNLYIVGSAAGQTLSYLGTV